MIQSFRSPKGGRVNREKPVAFFFDGVRYHGYEGDTLASALLANGVHLVGRSYKYHRPRGILSAGAEEPNALVGVKGGAGRFAPNLRATQIVLHEGLEVTSQNRWPSLGLDLGALNQLGGSLFSAGFYYKTFMGPARIGLRLWRHVFEPVIRQAAGLGYAPTEADPDTYAQYYEHCDVLVVGAGPAGLAAALAAGSTGARVILCDEQAELGGSLLADATARIEGIAASDWCAQTLKRLAALPNVRLMRQTQCFGYYAQNFLGLCERVCETGGAGPRERLWRIRAKEVVLATGAIERPLVFPSNDRPGVMLADAARTYANRYGVRVGSRVVIVTADDSAYQAAFDLRATGVEIALIADVRTEISGALPKAAMDAGFAVRIGMTVTGTKGRLRISGVELAERSAEHPRLFVPCDALLMCGGWTPSVHLFSQSRGTLAYDEAAGAFLPAKSSQKERSVGACRGTRSLSGALADGFAAGAEAAVGAIGVESAPMSAEVVGEITMTGGMAGELMQPDGSRGAKAFVDFQNDVTSRDIALAVQEGMHSIEHIKRYTTTGMATDQGKTSNLNALAIAAAITGKPIPKIGLTTFRQPYTPVTFGSFAGPNRGAMFDPVRRTPIHDWAAEQGATFEDVGLWKRAHFFPQAGETMHAAVARECRTVRAAAGMFDASTLGKIEVVGPDAAAFLDRMYVTPISRLSVGRCRYAILLNEAGFVIDDGVVARLAPDRFHVTTTTGGAARVLNLMEDYRQTEWPELNVWLTSITEQWAVIAIQGPRARDILTPLVTGCDIGATAMPHMSVREGAVFGCPARIMRMSFTGELGFEVNIPAGSGRAVWEALWDEGRKHGVVAYGTEAMHVLRAEKGFIIVGQETDGTVTPGDLGFGNGTAKSDFVGKRSLSRPDLVLENRTQLVGLLTEKPDLVLEEGAQIVSARSVPVGTPALGHVTSSYVSPALGRSIALALVAGGRARMGETLFVPMPGGDIAVHVVSPVFLDPEGVRLNG